MSSFFGYRQEIKTLVKERLEELLDSLDDLSTPQIEDLLTRLDEDD